MQKQLCYSLKGGGGGSGRSRWMTSWLVQHWTRHHSGFPRLFHLKKGQAAHYTTAALTLKFRANLCLTLSFSDCFLIICTNLCFYFSYSSSVSTGRAYALSGHSDAPSFQMTTNGVKDLYRPLYITCLLSQHLVWLNTDSSREQTCPMLLSFTARLPLQSSDTKLIEQVHNTIRWLELLKALTVCLLTRVRACSVNPKDSLPCKTLGVDIKPPSKPRLLCTSMAQNEWTVHCYRDCWGIILGSCSTPHTPTCTHIPNFLYCGLKDSEKSCLCMELTPSEIHQSFSSLYVETVILSFSVSVPRFDKFREYLITCQIQGQ